MTFDGWMGLKGYELKTRRFPGAKDSHIADNVGNVVMTKLSVLKPMHASQNTGVFIFKRVVTHKCIGTKAGAPCSAGATTADVLKEGFCIKCPVKQYTKAGCGSSCSVFSGTGAAVSDEEKTVRAAYRLQGLHGHIYWLWVLRKSVGYRFKCSSCICCRNLPLT